MGVEDDVLEMERGVFHGLFGEVGWRVCMSGMGLSLSQVCMFCSASCSFFLRCLSAERRVRI